MWHSVAFHLGLALSFRTRGADESLATTWDAVSTVCITHAAFKIVRQLVDAHIGHPPRSAFSTVPGFRGADKQSRTEHLVITAGFSLLPICYAVEDAFRPEGSSAIYPMVAVAYVALFLGSGLVHTRPGHRVRSLWRKKHAQHIGSDAQLRVPFDTWLTYSIFWCCIGAIKLTFGYYSLILPLRRPLEGLLVHPFAFIEVKHCELNFQLHNGPITREAFGALLSSQLAAEWKQGCFCEADDWCSSRHNTYEQVMRLLMVLLRCTVPWLVFQFDTYIWFNLCSAACSALLAVRRKIGVISQWQHLVKRYPEAVQHFNVKLLGTNNGDSLAAAAAASRSGKADWSVEARSAEWQCWARAWNELVFSLRSTDFLSDVERDELVFEFLGEGSGCEAFFGTAEYVLYPTMLTSPVFTAAAWQPRRSTTAYPSFTRTLLQTRDLLVWLCVKLGLVATERRRELMEVLTGLAQLYARMASSKRSGAAGAERLIKQLLALVEHLQALQRAPLPPRESAAETEIAEGIAAQLVRLMTCVKGLYVDGVDQHTLAIPLDDVTRGCADSWRRLQDLLKPETLIESSGGATTALHELHDAAAERVLAVLHRSLTAANPGCEPKNPEAKRQLLFFANSLFNTTMAKPPPVARMKSWSCFTPHYGEDVTYSMQQLKGDTGDNVNLQTLLVSLFPDEWEHFCERVGVLTMLTQLPESAHAALKQWASDRAQVLSRTVRGMMRYGDGLRVLARLEGVPEEDIEMVRDTAVY